MYYDTYLRRNFQRKKRYFCVNVACREGRKRASNLEGMEKQQESQLRGNFRRESRHGFVEGIWGLWDQRAIQVGDPGQVYKCRNDSRTGDKVWNRDKLG